jgi:hypothetical protein
VKALVDNQIASLGSKPDEAVEDTLDFLRNWAQFKVPTALTSLGNLAQDVLSRNGLTSTDPAVFAGQMENLFERDLQLTRATSLDDVLERLRLMQRPTNLSPFEREMFDDARSDL